MIESFVRPGVMGLGMLVSGGMKSSSVWTSVLVAITMAAPAAAAPTAPPAPVAPAPAASPVPMVPVPAAPSPLAALIAKKKPFDPAKLAARLSMANGSPRLTLASGRQVTLMPARPVAVATPVVDAGLQAKLSKYGPYLKARTFGPAKSTAAAPVPQVVDHRAFQTPVKDQGEFGTCTVFAVSAAIEMTLKKAYGATHDISEADAWSLLPRSSCGGDGAAIALAALRLRNQSVCSEARKPYTGSAGACGGINSQCEANRQYGLTGYATYTGTVYAPPQATEFANDTNLIEAALDLGLPVVVGVHLVGNGWHDGTAESGVIDRQSGDSSYFGNHSMLVVGYNQRDNYFILKNSWGTSFGHGGYAFLSYEYMQTLTYESAIIVGVRNPG